MTHTSYHILSTLLLLGAVNTTPLLDKDKGAKLGSISGGSGGTSSSGIGNISPVVGSGSGSDGGSNSHVHTNDHGGSKGSGSGSNGGGNSGSTSTLQGIVGRLDQIKISVSPAVSAVLGTFPYKF